MSVFNNTNSLTGGPYVTSIDFGTESCRAGIFDPTRAPMAFTAMAYKTTYLASGWAEQSPTGWWNALRASVHNVMQRSGVQSHKVEGISHDATTMTVVALDHGGEALRPAIMWMDVRIMEQMARVASTKSPARRYTGNGTLPPTAEWFPLKAAWLRENECETYDKAYHLVDVPDWLTFKPTSEWTQNISTTTHRMYYDRDNDGWPADLYEEVGAGDVFDKPFTVVNDLGVLVGGLPKSAAEAFDLIPGTSAAQGGDGAWYGQIGLNVLRSDKMSLVTGSSHAMSGQSPDPVSGPGFFGGYIDGVVPGQYTIEVSLASPGSVFKWLEDNSCPGINLAVEQTSLDAYDILNQRSADIPIGCDSLVVNEFSQGSRTPYSDSKARGVFTGSSLAHSREHICRAIQEAVCYGVEANLRKLREAEFEVQEFVVCGSATKSRMWAQMHSDVTGVPIALIEVGDVVILDSCILAAADAGLYGLVREAADAMVHERECTGPDVERHEQYKFYADQYCKQFPLMQGLIHETVDHVAAKYAATE